MDRQFCLMDRQLRLILMDRQFCLMDRQLRLILMDRQFRLMDRQFRLILMDRQFCLMDRQFCCRSRVCGESVAATRYITKSSQFSRSTTCHVDPEYS